MRLLFLIAAVLAVLYFTIGIRVGILPQTPVFYWNADGVNRYELKTDSNKSQVKLEIDSSINKGEIKISILKPNGGLLWEKKLIPGKEYKESPTVSLPVSGFYKIELNLARASGRLGLKWSIEQTI